MYIFHYSGGGEGLDKAFVDFLHQRGASGYILFSHLVKISLPHCYINVYKSISIVDAGLKPFLLILFTILA